MKIKPNKKKALMLAKRQLSELVCDAVNLEGINFTLPEVQTLLEGITVGGHKVSDQQIVLNQANAWKHIFQLLEKEQFEVSKDTVCSIHKIAAKEEALEWGCFRSGGVTIAGTAYLPPGANELNALFEKMLSDSETISDPFDRAIFYFLTMARCQFFFDVNKRMGRFVMNGYLLNLGYPAINVPAKRQLEFNQKMLRFYSSDDQTEMNAFMKYCIDERVIKIMNE